MKISVIIPTYKPAEYIWECLDSMEKQTFPKNDYEVILVLNGCKEPYESKIREYISKSDVNYNFIQTDEGGVSNARNIALDNVRGEYIMFIDDDDFVSASYLEELYAMSSAQTMALCYPYAFCDGDMKQLKYSMTEQYNARAKNGRQDYQQARKYFSGPCMKLIPMSFVENRRFDTRFKNGEDSLFMFLISDRFKWVDFTSEKAVYYRRVRENSAVTAKRTFGNKVKNAAKLIAEYVKVYARTERDYKLKFLITRVLGTIKSCFY